MKILSQPQHQEPTALLTCGKCKSELEVSKTDVLPMAGNYVACGQCREVLSAPLSPFPDLLPIDFLIQQP